MEGPLHFEMRAFAFANTPNTPILQYPKTARKFHRQSHSTLTWPKDRVFDVEKKVPHPCDSGKGGANPGGFNWIGSVRGLSKPYPFNSITWKYKGVNRYKAK